MNGLLQRVRRMDAGELRFRAGAELRKVRDRARTAILPADWRRESLPRILAPTLPPNTTVLERARRAAERFDWIAAHRELAAYFASRSSAFPLDGGAVAQLAPAIAGRFPGAPADARVRADRLLGGRFDLLGHVGVDFGRPPDWHADPLRGTRAPLMFWSSVPYLDVDACGDHKLVWELNRHQHFLTLGRAYALTHDVKYYEEFVLQLEDWLSANPPLQGINWSSMLELAFRSISWLWALAFFSPAAAAREGEEVPWIVDLLVAIDRQLSHVEHNLSQYFSPNTHLSGEALGLYVASQALPELRASRRRSAVGRRVLIDEIARQVSEDGGHVELSAHYHRYSTDFYLLALAVARRANDSAEPQFTEAAHRQARYLRALADDRGFLPLIGDDDGGQLFPICGRMPADCSDSLAAAATLLHDPALRVGAPPEETFWLCGVSAGLQSTDVEPAQSCALPGTGYYVSRTRTGDHLVFDAGRHGYLNGGHAHSDALAITLTVAGRPLLVDPGTGTYTADLALRDRLRSTAMHNTVTLNGRQQSQPRGPFHWESTAMARGFMWRAGDRCDYVEGTHDAYAPLMHTRTVLAVHGFGWLIVDHLLGAANAEAAASWHLAPEWTVADPSEKSVRLLSGDACSAIASTAQLEIVEDIFSPVYGLVLPSTTLRARIGGPLPMSFATFIAATADVASGLTIESLPGLEGPGAEWHAAAFNMFWAGGCLALVTAIERGGAPENSTAAPSTVWGTAGLRTDARTAAVLTKDGCAAEVLLINGSTVATASATVRLADDVRIARLEIPPVVAPSVHRVAADRPDERLRN